MANTAIKRPISVQRSTKETDITLKLNMDEPITPKINLGLPFLEHMLYAMSFHGGFGLEVSGKGDLAVDPHHLVEDVGLVLGQALEKTLVDYGPVQRYGQSLIPMDDALSEAVIDVCKRPYLVYSASWPQTHCGTFDMSLFREFFLALSNQARINLHLHVRYCSNSHHGIEALFKALGRALKMAYMPAIAMEGGLGAMSTKGAL